MSKFLAPELKILCASRKLGQLIFVHWNHHLLLFAKSSSSSFSNAAVASYLVGFYGKTSVHQALDGDAQIGQWKYPSTRYGAAYWHTQCTEPRSDFLAWWYKKVSHTFLACFITALNPQPKPLLTTYSKGWLQHETPPSTTIVPYSTVGSVWRLPDYVLYFHVAFNRELAKKRKLASGIKIKVAVR